MVATTLLIERVEVGGGGGCEWGGRGHGSEVLLLLLLLLRYMEPIDFIGAILVKVIISWLFLTISAIFSYFHSKIIPQFRDILHRIFFVFLQISRLLRQLLQIIHGNLRQWPRTSRFLMHLLLLNAIFEKRHMALKSLGHQHASSSLLLHSLSCRCHSGLILELKRSRCATCLLLANCIIL